MEELDAICLKFTSNRDPQFFPPPLIMQAMDHPQTHYGDVITERARPVFENRPERDPHYPKLQHGATAATPFSGCAANHPREMANRRHRVLKTRWITSDQKTRGRGKEREKQTSGKIHALAHLCV